MRLVTFLTPTLAFLSCVAAQVTTATPAVPTGCTPTATGALKPRSTGPPIVALDGWAAGSYLQKAQNSDAAILGPSSSRGWYLPSGAIRLIYWGAPWGCDPYLYLNTKLTETSYKPLAFEAVGTKFDWDYNGPNRTVSTNGFNTFVTCSDGALYLQTGSDLPSGNCTTTRLKIDQ
ncbi:hypothetical protein RSOLAG1IB_03839 [Rhizoctonia solani AG-1 IB]|uniref:Uncharacterized protein n=1 Tax=Thanatephorus cucumeris (strain AG1-IB / isolate 7/3/14) TaxID=1108050 RepID=A0A0B7FRM6_THACB|nr:hypothetical protein RSOLAG1IB_03839 [Rhizoctonia solani AG-1 IB]